MKGITMRYGYVKLRNGGKFSMRMFIVLLFVLLGWLQYHLWWGKNGIYDYLEVTAMADSVAVINEKLAVRNQQMYAEISDLQQGKEAIEELARNQLGLIKPSETFFRIIND